MSEDVAASCWNIIYMWCVGCKEKVLPSPRQEDFEGKDHSKAKSLRNQRYRPPEGKGPPTAKALLM